MTHLFGWCMDGDHARCRFQLTYTDHQVGRILRCSCDCHREAS